MHVKRARACAIVVHAESLLMVRLEDPISHAIYHTPPGGGIEPGESARACALRETFEETGYEIELLDSEPITASYEFFWNGETFDCTTSFFRALLKKPEERAAVADVAYNLGHIWIPLSKVRGVLGYHPAILQAVESCLSVPLQR